MQFGHKNKIRQRDKIDRYIDKQTINRQKDRLINRQIDKWIDGQKDKMDGWVDESR